MGRSQQPYLYQPVIHGAPFNPKAYSHALNAQECAPPKPQHEGPLLTFNRHPDSYDISPYGRHVGVQEMSSTSKKSILWARRVQLAWRMLQWVAATGVLVCVCMMKGAPDTQSWILRLPPAFDVAVQTYAIWHLCHKATRYPPSSTASYHGFALALDIGFIAFAVFAFILTRSQFEIAPGTVGRWRTVLTDRSTDSIIFQTAMLASVVSAGLHAVTVLIGGYLIYMFRKIAELPPDMNPLEDNLTRRTKKERKHKYKNSDMSNLIGEDKRFSEISARNSKHTLTEDDPLRMSQMSEKLMGVDNRSSGVSFFQSRDGQQQQHAYSPHNPETARHSWHANADVQRESPYQQPAAHGHTPTKSRTSIAEHDRYGTSRTMSPMPASAPRIAKRFSATPTTPIPIYDESHTAEGANWETLPGDDDDRNDEFDPYRYQAKQQGRLYESIPLEDDADLGFRKIDTLGADLHDGSPSNALRMNPPTPEPHVSVSPLAKLSQGYNKENAHHEDERTTTMMTSTSSVYSQPETTLSNGDEAGGKTRFYTDLAAAMRGVRQHPPAVVKAQSVAGSVHTHVSASTNASSQHSRIQPATQGDKRIRPSGTVIRKPLRSFDESNGLQAGYTFAKASPSRVVSRSGVDVDFVAGDLGTGNRRREVSGKVAEEGRGGIWRRVSGRTHER